MVVGIGFGIAAAFVESPLHALFLVPFGAVFFGVAMYHLTIRRNVVAAVESLSPPPTPDRERRGATVRRVVLEVGLSSAALVVVVLLVGRPALVGGICAGMGGTLLFASHWLELWQQERSALVLREPHYRWTGGGIADRRDFYVVESPGDPLE